MRFIALLFVFAFGQNLFAQEDVATEVIHKIDSEAFGKERKISVFLPQAYFDFPDDTFIVTYVLDAQYDQFFRQATGNIEYLVDTYEMTRTIVVGIHTENRASEFTPVPSNQSTYEDWGEIGNAPLLQAHFRNEIFPFIKENYRVNDFKAIVGHSRAGTFVVHTLFSDQNDLFNAYIGISPALEYDNDQIVKDAESYLKSNEPLNAFLYCSAGDVNSRERMFASKISSIDSLITLHPNNTLVSEITQFKGKDHWTCVVPSINEGLLEMTRAIRPDMKVILEMSGTPTLTIGHQLDNFYAKAQELFGWSDELEAWYIARVGGEMFDLEEYHNALQVFHWGLQKYPNHFQLNKFNAETYAKIGKTRYANNLYLEMLDYLEYNRSSFGWEEFIDQQEFLKKKIEETAE